MHQSEYHLVNKFENTHFWYRAMNELTINILKKRIKQKVKILDAGCGTGGLSQKLKQFGKVTAIDINNLALQYARKKKLDRVIKASVCSLPFKKNSFDVIISLDVIYHKKVEDDIIALKEMNRVLKPGGIIILRVPAFECLRGGHDIVVETKHRYSLPELKYKLVESGYHIIKISYCNMILSIPLFMKRFIERHIKQKQDILSDTILPPRIINELFYFIFRQENKLLNKRINFPFGSSIICLAKK